MRTRTLVLKKETLTELGAADLRHVVGGDTTTVAHATTPKHCITNLLTCHDTCMSWHTEPC